ncbi:MAG TPA: hypothetical protein VGO33_00735 [Gemmatimonadaceae bacterium]|nr:hypothetical protein [Gemmatimonadaceae bacterium]
MPCALGAEIEADDHGTPRYVVIGRRLLSLPRSTGFDEKAAIPQDIYMIVERVSRPADEARQLRNRTRSEYADRVDEILPARGRNGQQLSD